jgi:hypothetical protein
MDKYKIFEEIQYKIGDLLEFELTNDEIDDLINMLEILSKMWSRQRMLYKSEYESIM